MHWFFYVFGAMNVANGLWMLLAPADWYHDLPAGVPDTGPLNTHFVRDIGAAFLTIGVAFVVAARWPAMRRGVLLFSTMFYVLHAAVHVADLVGGHVHAGHWLIDLPGVWLPAVVLLVLCLPRFWPQRARA
ncbi:MAG: DUF4345 family protein [Thermodesulfobacteriota bacterium]